jgi:uncharacterized protein with NRDE domain
MCVIAIAHLASKQYPLIVAANRDERHSRESAAADWWQEMPRVLGGRDLVAGGSWFAIAADGRLAAVTNIVNGRSGDAELSRGKLVRDFLGARQPSFDYADEVENEKHRFAAFNLLLLEQGRLQVLSNRYDSRPLTPGIHAFSNNPPGTSWPKVDQLKRHVDELLADRNPANKLVDALSGPRARGTFASAAGSIFVVGENFGTRCSTVVVVDAHGRAEFIERRFDLHGECIGTSRFEFDLQVSTANV